MTETILLAGATGTIGAAVAKELVRRGAHVICPVRKGSKAPDGTEPLICDISQAGLAALDVPFDAVISCLASRSGTPEDAWAIDHAAHVGLLTAAAAQGARFVLLSAICVQKPKLAFQHAKLAFEAKLETSDLPYSIVRPTAYFKSLSGQFERVKSGKPFLLFGNGELTACKPISDRDLAQYMLRCLDDPDLENRILPIGGPGPALTPKMQGQLLFDALGMTPRFRHVPVGLMTGIMALLSAAGKVSKSARAKAELARIGTYYATESMLVWDEARASYDAHATPEFGTDTLADHYRAMASGAVAVDLGDHAVF